MMTLIHPQGVDFFLSDILISYEEVFALDSFVELWSFFLKFGKKPARNSAKEYGDQLEKNQRMPDAHYFIKRLCAAL